MTDPPKAFDCNPHDLLTAKPEAYGFIIATVPLVFFITKKSETT